MPRQRRDIRANEEIALTVEQAPADQTGHVQRIGRLHVQALTTVNTDPHKLHQNGYQKGH